MKVRKLLGIAVAMVMCCGLASVAMGDFVAYNDFSGTSAGNVTSHGLHTGGTLVDYDTGGALTARVDTWGLDNTGNVSGGSPITAGGGYNFTAGPGTLFNGIIDMSGLIQYGDTGWYTDTHFSGLDPSKAYDVVVTANRGSSSAGYDARWSKFTLHDATEIPPLRNYPETYSQAHTQASETGAGGEWVFQTPASNITMFSTGRNWSTGYGAIAQWLDVRPNATGEFWIRVEADDEFGEARKGYGIQALRLIEHDAPGGAIPEPAGLGLVGLALLAVRRRRS